MLNPQTGFDGDPSSVTLDEPCAQHMSTSEIALMEYKMNFLNARDAKRVEKFGVRCPTEMLVLNVLSSYSGL